MGAGAGAAAAGAGGFAAAAAGTATCVLNRFSTSSVISDGVVGVDETGLELVEDEREPALLAELADDREHAALEVGELLLLGLVRGRGSPSPGSS